eukprot:gene2423-2457_t
MAFPSVHPALDRALTKRDYLEPTPVQLAVLEAQASDKDLLVSAQTGSGKTVAFGLAMASTLLGEADRLPQAAEPMALIIAPTRELALQVHRELLWLYAEAGARVVSCVGGMDSRAEQRALAAGCHIVVGTPGRLRDHLERGKLDSSKLRVVVLDEADEMLDLGFREDLGFILEAAPATRRTLLFSATLPREIVALARQYQRDSVRIDTVNRNQPHSDIEYRAIRIAPNELEHAIVNILRFFDTGAALVFCATREGVRHLQAALLERGFGAVALSGELSQNERSHALQALRDGRARVCVATDVAARGLDLPDLGLVIHADLPNNRETLLHRSGRTGRAGRKGLCVLMVPYTKRRRAESLLSQAGVAVTWSGPPSAAEIRAKDQERLVNDAVFAEEPTEDDLALAKMLLEKRTAEELATALARFYRARLPAPEDLFDSPQVEREAPQERRKRHEPLHQDFAGDSSELSGEHVWFTLNIGRDKNADPKWLIPLICRHGHITKREIGSIKIFDRETRFEIAQEYAVKFGAAARQTGDKDIKIEAATSAMPMKPARRGPPPERSEGRRDARPDSRPERAGKPSYPPKAPGSAKPYAGKPAGGAKPYGAPKGEGYKGGDFKKRPDKGAPKPNRDRLSDHLAQTTGKLMMARDPMATAMGLGLIEIAPGQAQVDMLVQENMVNALGLCSGGAIFALAESCFLLACNSHNQRAITQGATIHHIAPAKTGERLIATGFETYGLNPEF